MPRPFASVVELAADAARPTRSPRPRPLHAPGAWPSAAASSCVPPKPTTRPTRTSPPNWTVTATPSASGANASSPAGLAGLQDAPRSGRPRSFSPRRTARRHHDRQQQDRRASTSPSTAGPSTRSAATIVNEAHAQAISRATIWRILDAGRPQAAPERLLAQQPRPRLRRQGQGDLPAVRQRPALLPAGSPGAVLRREDRDADPGPASTRPNRPGPGQPREAGVRVHPPGHADDDHHVRACRPGEVVWDLGPTRTSLDFGGAPAARGGALPGHEAVRLGGGQPEHALEPGAVRGGGRTSTACRSSREELQTQAATACVPERPRRTSTCSTSRRCMGRG